MGLPGLSTLRPGLRQNMKAVWLLIGAFIRKFNSLDVWGIYGIQI